MSVQAACQAGTDRVRGRPDDRWRGARFCGWKKLPFRMQRDLAAGCSVRGAVMISGGEGCVDEGRDEAADANNKDRCIHVGCSVALAGRSGH